MEKGELIEMSLLEKRVRSFGATAIDHFGDASQIEQALEEALELALALRKYLRSLKSGRDTADNAVAVRREIADVKIMIAQLESIFGFDESVLRFKLNKAEFHLLESKMRMAEAGDRQAETVVAMKGKYLCGGGDHGDGCLC